MTVMKNEKKTLKDETQMNVTLHRLFP